MSSESFWGGPRSLRRRFRFLSGDKILAQAARLDAERRKAQRGEITFGPWVYVPGARAFRHVPMRYDIPLKRCTDSAAVLDWIAQIASKDWGTAECIGHLVLAFDAVLSLQENYCGSAMNGRRGRSARKVIRALTQAAAT